MHKIFPKSLNVVFIFIEISDVILLKNFDISADDMPLGI